MSRQAVRSTLDYTCTYCIGSVLRRAFNNTATATWDSSRGPHADRVGFWFEGRGASAIPTHDRSTRPSPVTDTFNSGLPETKGTLTATDATPYTYGQVHVPAYDQCPRRNNCAKYLQHGDDRRDRPNVEPDR